MKTKLVLMVVGLVAVQAWGQDAQHPKLKGDDFGIVDFANKDSISQNGIEYLNERCKALVELKPDSFFNKYIIVVGARMCDSLQERDKQIGFNMCLKVINYMEEKTGYKGYSDDFLISPKIYSLSPRCNMLAVQIKIIRRK